MPIQLDLTVFIVHSAGRFLYVSNNTNMNNPLGDHSTCSHARNSHKCIIQDPDLYLPNRKCAERARSLCSSLLCVFCTFNIQIPRSSALLKGTLVAAA